MRKKTLVVSSDHSSKRNTKRLSLQHDHLLYGRKGPSLQAVQIHTTYHLGPVLIGPIPCYLVIPYWHLLIDKSRHEAAEDIINLDPHELAFWQGEAKGC